MFVAVGIRKALLCALIAGAVLLHYPQQAVANDAVDFVTIGEQRWMKRNIAVTRFRNGDPIARQDDAADWAIAGKSGTPAYTSYDTKVPPPEDWGLLYNFAAIIDPRGICPVGWRVPNNQDWLQLEAFLGGGAGAANALKSRVGWAGGTGGSDATGFSALPAGWRTQDGIFYLAGRIGYFWTSELSPDGTVMSHMVFDVERPMFRIGYNRGMGQSLRCLAE